MKRYTKEHLCFEQVWNEEFKMSVTPYGLDLMGEVAYIEAIAKRKYSKGETISTLETFKTVVDIVAPCDLEVVAVKDYGHYPDEIAINNGYLCDIHAEDIGETMNGDEYEEYCALLRD